MKVTCMTLRTCPLRRKIFVLQLCFPHPSVYNLDSVLVVQTLCAEECSKIDNDSNKIEET